MDNKVIPYDSTDDTKAHMRRVKSLIDQIRTELFVRGATHDLSKLGPEEKPYFDEMTPLLKDTVYGSKEAKEQGKKLKPALAHHKANNRHHIEFHERGIDVINLVDIVEMFCDWKAASERGKDGSIERSIEIGRERYKISDQLANIFTNTIPLLK